MAALSAKGLQRLRSVLQSHVDRGRIPGAIAVVALGGHVECFETIGQLDARAGTPLPADAIFRIYSMTKPLVSLAALMLAEEGRLQLTDEVAAFLPEFGSQQVAVEEGAATRLVPACRPATLHDLLRHTAGLTYEFLGDSAVQRQYRDARVADRSRSNAEFCKVLGALPLAHHPGDCWEYSRATDVLGAVLEVVTGQPLGALLRERIFEPQPVSPSRVCGARLIGHPERDVSRVLREAQQCSLADLTSTSIQSRLSLGRGGAAVLDRTRRPART